MNILRIEHHVQDYAAWKKNFDSDPVGRKHSGVRRYRVSRAHDDPNFVTIELELETARDAEALHAQLRGLWSRVGLADRTQVRIFDVADSAEC